MTGGSRLRFGVLGAFRVERDGREVDPGPRLQRALLAILVVGAGHESLDQVRAHLGQEQFEQAHAMGMALSSDEALDRASGRALPAACRNGA